MPSGHPSRLPPAPPAPPPAIPPPGAVGARVGPWRLEEALGPGTFTATEVATGAAVVVKVAEPTPAAVARTRREAAALEALGGGDHPALVAAVGAHDCDGVVAVATRRVPGAPLDQLVAELGPLPFPVAAGLLAPVAEALESIHRRGWVHADVSPANVVVDGGRAVLVDLGSAHRVGLGGPTEAFRATAAPEVLAGEVPAPAADVWSLAAVAVVAVTGEPPTPGSPLAASVALVLRRALATEPSARPSAGELAASLRAVAGPAAPTNGPAPAPPPQPRAERVTVDLGTRPPTSASPTSGLPAWPVVLLATAMAVVAVVLEWSAR